MSKAYYNEHDSFAAAWLRELIKANLIVAGDVDERNIQEVKPSELEGYKQVHLFAGIGGWSYALRLAGWPDDRPVWTGSCPCQPFSAAGNRKGVDDSRHLWPHFRWLLDQCRPATIFGEQVASKAGRAWLSTVRSDLEALGYAVGAADFGAASVGAPHIRQRLWWVADTESQRQHRGEGSAGKARRASFEDGSRLVNTKSEQVGLSRCPWQQGEAIDCADGKQRFIEPGTFPLANGVPNRVGKLRGYGNAIVPQVAAEFIKAYQDIGDTNG